MEVSAAAAGRLGLGRMWRGRVAAAAAGSHHVVGRVLLLRMVVMVVVVVVVEWMVLRVRVWAHIERGIA